MHAILTYARSFLGVPYVWGGNNRLSGMDCSAFACEVLRAFGLVYAKQDFTAGMLLKRFYDTRRLDGRIAAGDLLFFGKSDQLNEITHVAIALSPTRMIEAGGGDSSTRDLISAAKHGAMVRERPISFRSDLVAVATPMWPTDP